MAKTGRRLPIGLAAKYGRTLIVPMTLVDTMYRDEIFGLITDAGHPLLHVFLDVPALELRRPSTDRSSSTTQPMMRRRARSGTATSTAASPRGMVYRPRHWCSAEITTHQPNWQTRVLAATSFSDLVGHA